MSKKNKSKNNFIDKLHKILDNRSPRELPSENEKYLLSLKKRVKDSSKNDLLYNKIVTKHKRVEEIDPLKPKVSIYPREEIKIKEPIITEEITKPVEIEEKFIPKERIELSIEDEDIFEVEKPEKEPEFIEVKPVDTSKEEKKSLADEELTEWESVDKKRIEELEELPIKFKEIKKEFEEEVPSPIPETKEFKEIEITTNFCPHCGTRLSGAGTFCGTCGKKLTLDVQKWEPIEEIPTKTEEKKEEEIYSISEEKEQIPTWEPIEKIPPKTEEPAVEREIKVQAFKDLESIDEKTAILLYDNEITSIETLKITPIKNIIKIKGINRKKAKQIKKELKKKIKWNTFEIRETEEINSISEELKEDIVIEKPEKIEEKEQIPIWEPIEEIPPETEEKKEIPKFEPEVKKLQPQKEPKIDKETKIQAFKGIESIDKKTAILLYDNEITSIETLKITPIKNITKIKGIKKSLAKKIKKEIKKKIELEPIEIEEPEQEIQIPEEKEEDAISTPKEKPEIEKKTKIQAFKGIESIDKKTAILLYDNEITSIETLKITPIKNITKIKGINRKKAKQIKKELEEISKPKPKKKKVEKRPKKKTKISKKSKIIEKHEPPEIEEKIIEEDIRKDVFKDITTIDEKIAKLLLKNNIDTLVKLQNTTIKELVKIKGIKRKIAKKIKKEINDYMKKENESILKESNINKENQILKETEKLEELTDEWEYYDEDKITGDSFIEIKGFRYDDFTLYEKTIEGPSGKVRTVRFFSKAEPEGAEPIELPKGYEVKVNKKTGVPYLKRKK